MARPRKPTNLLAFTGAFKKDPARGRARAHEPKVSSELGPMPPGLTQHEQRAWQIIVSNAPAGVLKGSDFVIVHLAASLYGQLLAGNRKPQVLGQLRLVLTQLGMTPSALSTVSGQTEGDEHGRSIAAL